MKTIVKRIIPLLLSLLLALTIMPQLTLAEDNAEAEETGLTSLQIEDMEIAEYSAGFWTTLDGEEFFRYNLADSDQFQMTIVYNGQTISGPFLTIHEALHELTGEWLYLDFDCDTTQYTDHWTAGNTYTVTGSLLGLTDTFDVTINQNPLSSLQIENIEIVENTNGYWSSNYDPETGEVTSQYFTYRPADSSKFQLSIVYDGTTYSGNWNTIYNKLVELTGERPSIQFQSTPEQYEEPWIAGNTYTLTGILLGQKDTFEVTIKKNPLTSFQIQDVELIEGTHGDMNSFWDETTQSFEGYFYYFPNYYNDLVATITYNGKTYTGTAYSLKNQIEADTGDKIDSDMFGVSTDQSYDNQWVAGGTYKAQGSFLNLFCEFNVTIKASPLTSLQIEDLEIVENTNGYWSSGGPENQQYWYYLPQYSNQLQITIVYEGETYSGSWSNVQNTLYNQTGEWFSLNSASDPYQSYENQWTAGNTYNVTASLMGKTAPFKVTIKKSPLTSLQIDDIDIIENTSGYWNTYGPEGPQYWYYAPESSNKLQVTIVYDGTTYSGSWGNIQSTLYNQTGEWFSLNITSDQSYENQWTAGNTYNVTATMMGKTDTFNVTIKNSPLTSLHIDDLEIVENSYGYWNTDGPGGQQYWYYNPQDSYKMYVTAVYEGQTYSGLWNDVQNSLYNLTGEMYSLNITSDPVQSYENRWTLGNSYTVSANLLGKITTFQVKIVESPLTSVEIEDLEIVETTCGFWNTNGPEQSGNQQYFYYYPMESNNLKVTVVYDKKTYTGTWREVQQALYDVTKENFYLNYSEETPQSYVNQWKAGNTYNVTATLQGKTAAFKVSIKKSPLTSLKVEDMEVIEGTNGSYSVWDNVTQTYQYYYNYSLMGDDRMRMSIVYDGETYSGSFSQVQTFLRKKTGSNSVPYSIETDQSFTNQWTAGNKYKATLSFLGQKVDFNVSIKASGLTAFSVKDITVLEGTHGYQSGPTGNEWHYNLNELINASYTYQGKQYSGTYFDINDQLTSLFATSVYIQYEDKQNDTAWVPGKTYEVKAYLLGKTCTFKVTVQKGVTPTGIKPLVSDKITLYKGFMYANNLLAVTYEPSNGKQGTTWQAADPSIISISGQGAAASYSAQKAGTTTVTATSRENPQLKQTFNVTVLDGEPPAGTYTVSMRAGRLSDPSDYSSVETSYINPKAISMKPGEAYYVSITLESDTCVPSVFNSDYIGKQLTHVKFTGLGGGGRITERIKFNFAFILTGTTNGSDVLKIGDYTLNLDVSDDAVPLFNDVQDKTAWYYNTVYQIASTKNKNGKPLMSGYSNGSNNFGPADPLTRQDFAVILYRLADEPAITPMDNPFTDTNPNGYYYNCVLWAKAENVIAGYNGGRFGVGDKITREQVATILYRFAKDYMHIDTSAALEAGDLSKFNDGTAVSSWAETALQWATGAGVITGKSGGTELAARGNAARSEIGAMVIRFIKYMNANQAANQQ